MDGEGNGGNTNNANVGRRSEERSILGSAVATCQLVEDSFVSIERVHAVPSRSDKISLSSMTIL